VTATTYVERAVPPAARDLLTCGWSRTVSGTGPGVQRVVPDACADVIWHRETGALFVAGPDTRAQLTALTPGTLVGVRFHPGRSPAGLGHPADALRDGRVDLGDVWSADRADRLADALAETTSTATALRLLTDAVTEERGVPDPAAPELLRLAGANTRIPEIADRFGLTERQVHRRCVAAFGYGPKMLAKVLRFDRAVRLAREGMAFADVAAETGYADQAHLSRDVATLAGVPLSVLIGRR
jgi:AraC-like DNA-binding protein